MKLINLKLSNQRLWATKFAIELAMTDYKNDKFGRRQNMVVACAEMLDEIEEQGEDVVIIIESEGDRIDAIYYGLDLALGDNMENDIPSDTIRYLIKEIETHGEFLSYAVHDEY